ncbi:hypothetical protein H0H81_001641 [Sphagnurus paluster]|uniref:F-box domain-containing protein n=1 Tax=Sphagnurus paluster TaxID=117069 RepID=A0A9P7GM80_9AGAR|nr:hypothetical protein H0H81_001641 [Sphagnurus paluster]
MMGLQNTKIRIKDEIEKCKSFLAPVRLLPSEILIEIFLHLYTIARDPEEGLRPHQPSISVSQVCSTWRKASLMCPELWSVIKFSVRMHDYFPTRRMAEFITQWYSRAEGRPLSFSLSHPWCSLDIIQDLRSILWALLPFLDRIYHLCLDMDYWDRITSFLSQGNASMRALQKLEIYKNFKNSNVQLFRVTPALRDATLGISSDIIALPAHFEFPWANLTRLDLFEPITDRAFYHIIKQCSSLVRASFSVDLDLYSELSFPGELPDRFFFPKLEALQLQFCGYEREPSVAEITIASLSFPAMKQFQLSAIDSAMVVPLYTVASMLNIQNNRSATLITCLVLTNIVIDHYNFATMLGACLALEKLAVESNWDSKYDTLIALLGDAQISSPPAPSLPNLTSFALVANDKIMDALLRKLSSLVHAWSSNPARRRPLETISVYYHDTDGFYDPQWAFSKLRKLIGLSRTDDEVETIAESGIVLKTHMISKILNDHFPPRETLDLALELDWFRV